ncbi:hypothetical protein DL96DRAFT_1681790 [Flagelloscypha sp. PMI_526]|nr:hypothetical protein DL96DRAFT_1681790 [Flagelloscypha sp. PMI_526]
MSQSHLGDHGSLMQLQSGDLICHLLGYGFSLFLPSMTSAVLGGLFYWSRTVLAFTILFLPVINALNVSWTADVVPLHTQQNVTAILVGEDRDPTLVDVLLVVYNKQTREEQNITIANNVNHAGRYSVQIPNEYVGTLPSSEAVEDYFARDLAYVIRAINPANDQSLGQSEEFIVFWSPQDGTPTPTQISNAVPSSTSGNPNPAETKTKNMTGAIVGGVIGGLAFLAIVALTFFYLRRRRAKSNETPGASLPIPQKLPEAGVITPAVWNRGETLSSGTPRPKDLEAAQNSQVEFGTSTTETSNPNLSSPLSYETHTMRSVGSPRETIHIGNLVSSMSSPTVVSGAATAVEGHRDFAVPDVPPPEYSRRRSSVVMDPDSCQILPETYSRDLPSTYFYRSP